MDAGKAVFFTNIKQTKFSEDARYKFNVRKGAEEDKKNFESVFWNTFGFKPLITGQEEESSVTNLTLDKWRNPDPNHKELKNCQCWVCRFKCPDLKNSKYVLVAFSSHGNEEISAGKRQPSVILSDGNSLTLTDILKALNNKTLKDIPKIVMLLSCRVFLKDPETFDTPLLPYSDISLNKEKLQIQNLSDTFVELKWKTQANANMEYEIKQTTKDSNQEWKNATFTSKDSTVDQTSYTVFKITDLEPNTTYCFLLRDKVGQEFGALLEKEFVRTLDCGEDPGVSGESTPDQPPEGNDDEDPLLYKNNRFEVKKGPAGEKTLIEHPPVTFEDVYSAEKIPNDFLIVYGTTRGRNAKRHETRGSWVMEEMTRVVTQEKDDKELNMLRLLTKVAQRMANRKTVHETEEYLRNKKSILCFSHTLTENIILKKKIAAPPAL